MWYQGHPLQWALFPLMILFWLLSSCRRLLFRMGVKQQTAVTSFVIVVGNISVGGNGKTPVVLALAEYLKSMGLQVGILSRGYGATSPYYPREVAPEDPASEVGDEPRLLRIRAGVPVVIDPVRSRGAKYLSEHLKCDVIICDDGLQHYALKRDMEVVVMDGRQTGNGWLLPMGPLREGRWRLKTVDAIIHNVKTPRDDISQPAAPPEFVMQLSPCAFRNVRSPEKTRSSEEFSHPHALAGIGDPSRFFTQLQDMGIGLASGKGFADHHQFTRGDIPEGEVIMTEKDAVKVQSLVHENCWYLPVDAKLADTFYDLVHERLTRAGYLQKG